MPNSEASENIELTVDKGLLAQDLQENDLLLFKPSCLLHVPKNLFGRLIQVKQW